MTRKEFREAKYNLDDIKFVVEGLARMYPYVGNGVKYDFVDIELKAKNVFYSLQDQVSNKLKNTKGVLPDEVTTIKENC